MTLQKFRLAATGVRITIGAVVAIACALGVTAAVAAPWPQLRTNPATVTVAPVPGNTNLVCNGSFRALGRDASQADRMVSAAAPRLRVEAADGAAEKTALEMPGLSGGVGAQTITGAVVDRKAPLIAASEAFSLNEEDLRGFAAAPCREASMRSWLVGGDVSTGAADVILLSNPGSVPATVDLNVYGVQRSATTTVVPPQTQVGLSLASVSAGEQRPVIEVVASGAPVRASLQSALTRTLDPVGIDLQDGLSGAQENLHLLGVRASPATAGDDATGVVLRLLAPGSAADVTVRVHAAGSGQAVDEYGVELVADVPNEIALSGLKEGAYDIEVIASAPVVAGARQTARDNSREDFSWMLPAPQLIGKTIVSVPSGAPATLYLRNPSDEAVTVTIEGTDSRSIEVPAQGAKTVALGVGTVTLDSADPVHAAIGMRGGEGSAAIAGWPLWAPSATQKPIVVRQ